MVEHHSPTVEGLQLWLPSDSFHLDYNVNNLRDAMPDLQALSILNKPDEDAIYCGGNDGVIYHIVREEVVGQREAELRKQLPNIDASLQPNQTVDSQEIHEEARLRELHLGLGRTCLMLAHAAKDTNHFMKASHDLQYIFSMLAKPIHELDSLSETPMHESGLVYLFVQAARRHKILSYDDATKLSDALGHGILPISPDQGKGGETWDYTRGKNFIARVSFAQSKPVHTNRSRRAPKPRKSYSVHQEESSTRERSRGPVRSKAETFLHRLIGDRSQLKYSEYLAHAYDVFFGDDPKPFEVRNDTRNSLAIHGVEAYLDAASKRGNDEAGQILSYISGKVGRQKRPLLPLIVIGNIMTARANEQGRVDGKLKDLPGLEPRGIPQGFEAVRYLIEKKVRQSKKSAENKMLGEIVSGYLKAAFSSSDEEDTGSYELQPAPDDFVSSSDFAKDHDIERSMLENTLIDYGIDAGTYMFGRRVKKGLSPGDQEVLLSVIDELRIPRAPEGWRSISGFAHLQGTAKTVIHELIEDLEIETSTYRFRTKLGEGISPEDQEEIAKIIAERRAERAAEAAAKAAEVLQAREQREAEIKAKRAAKKASKKPKKKS